MPQGYTKVEKQRLWERWTREIIFMDGGVTNYAPRHCVMREFIYRGVVPFLKAKGYTTKDPKQITLSFLRYLFTLYLGQKVRFLNPYKKESNDHLVEFEDRFDTMEMEPFWKRWGSIQDFEEGRYAHEVRYTLPYFLWTQIVLQSSPAYIKLERILDELDEMENIVRPKESKGKEDPYLQESTRYTYEDRHW